MEALIILNILCILLGLAAVIPYIREKKKLEYMQKKQKYMNTFRRRY